MSRAVLGTACLLLLLASLVSYRPSAGLEGDEETQSDASDRPTTPPESFARAFGSHAKGDAKESADEGHPAALLLPHQRKRTTGTHVAPVRGQRAGAPAGQAGGSTPQEQGQQGSGLGRARPRRRRRPADLRF